MAAGRRRSARRWPRRRWSRIEKALPGHARHFDGGEDHHAADMESALGVTAGDLDGGVLASDQMLALRPGPRTAAARLLSGRPLGAGRTARHRRGGFCRRGRADGGWRAMSERAAAIVIGAGIGGLAAAAYLARGGLHTLLLEAGQAPREPAEALVALDPRMVAELRLPSRGLAFTASRSAAGRGEATCRCCWAAIFMRPAAALAKFSDADALAWPLYRRRLDGGSAPAAALVVDGAGRKRARRGLERGRAARFPAVSVFPARMPIWAHASRRRPCWRRCCGMPARAASPSASPVRRWRWSGARRRRWRDCRGGRRSREPGTLVASLRRALGHGAASHRTRA